MAPTTNVDKICDATFFYGVPLKTGRFNEFKIKRHTFS